MTNSSIKKILSVDRHAMQDLHTVLGFDFCKPFSSWYIDGRFTVKQIEKEAEKRGHDNAVIAICARDRHGWNKDFSLATTCGGVVSIDYKTPWYSKGRGLDNFYTKGSFEEVRKSNGAEAVVFVQNREYINKPSGKKVDFSERFKVERVNKSTDGKGNRWISRLDLRQTTNNGKRVEYGGQWYINGSNAKPQQLNDVIDKSGYILLDRRAELQRRAAALRAERAKAAYNATDNTRQLEELREIIQKRKSEIVEMLQNANTAKELIEVETALSRWKGFAGIVSDFERFKSNTENKKYKSIDDSNKAYQEIKKALEA